MKVIRLFVVVFLLFGSAINMFAAEGKSSSGNKTETQKQFSVARYLDLSKTLIEQGRYEEAAIAIGNYIDQNPNADRSYYQAVMDLLLQPEEKVEMKNLGSKVNSATDDYFPRITSDGNTLYFISSERSGGVGGEDSWFSRKINGEWSTPQNFGKQLNTSTHEGILAISGDDNTAIVFGNYKGSFGSGDLFYSVRRGDRWTLPCNLGGTINSDNWESMANLSPDGRTMLFVSDRAGGYGDADIWVSTLTLSGWTTPINLGSVINTSGSEGYPFLAADNKTLYFASTGHPGLGGRDLFVARRIGDSWTEWTKPVNLGKEINTTQDDQDLTIPASGDIGFMVKQNQPGGLGGYDIYTFTLPESMRPEKVYQLSGTVKDEEGNPVVAIVRYLDKETNAEVTYATSSSLDGRYSVTLKYGKEYIISIDMRGYLELTDAIDLKKITDAAGVRDYTLQKIKVGLSFELKNIYFDSGKSVLKDESKVELDKLVEILKRTVIEIEIGGHTDNVGSDESNQKLSQARVDAVKVYLVEKGIPAERIKSIGYGESQPIASNDNDEGKARNRRVEVKVTKVVEEQTDGGKVEVKEATKEEQKEEAKFDMLANLQLAAAIGGLPAGSPCSDKTYQYGDVPLLVDNTKPKYYYDNSDEEVLGDFSISLQNYGFKNGGTGWGIGLDFGSLYGAYYFSAPDGVKLLANLGYKFDFGIHDLTSLPLDVLLRADAMGYTNEEIPGVENKFNFYLNVPVGLRYTYPLKDFGVILAGDVLYNVGVLKSERLSDASINTGYFTIGVNARYNMFQGGLFINSGDFVNYFGIRLGVTF